MEPIISFSEKDKKRNIIVEPAWYLVQIGKVTAKLANSQETTNYWIEGEIICNADNGDTKYAGVPTPYLWMFNTGAIGKAYGFITCLIGREPEIDERFNLMMAEGKQIKMFIGNGLWQGQTQNTVTNQYKPAA